ncbi:MAG: hypothetical protein IPK71_05755 [Myxococcales bacterium]|nr:hypothetical protein [Myxococcales bacterium]
MKRLGVVLVVVSVSACEAFLGGLPEGEPAARNVADGPSDARAASPPREPGCTGWLPGSRYRRRLIVRAPEVVRRYPVRFSLDTLRLRREGKVNEVEPGLLLVDASGKPVPYVFDGPSFADAAALYAAIDVSGGDQELYLYYGGLGRGLPSAQEDVFVPGIVFDGSFADPSARAWSPLPAPRGLGYEIRIDGGRARFTMLGKGSESDHSVGLCQFTSFPPGLEYSIVYDAGFVSAPRHFRVTTQGVGGAPVPSAFEGPVQQSVRAGPIRPGDALLCFMVDRLSIDTVVDFWIDNVRVIPWVRNEPSVVAVGPEERCDGGP